MTKHSQPSGAVHGTVASSLTLPARTAARLGTVVTGPGPLRLTGGHEQIRVPEDLRSLLITALNARHEGRPVTLIVGEAGDCSEISSQEAANLLNVSRPYVVRLARDGTLPHRKVGNRHRFIKSDVLAFKSIADARRAEVLADLMQDGTYSREDF